MTATPTTAALTDLLQRVEAERNDLSARMDKIAPLARTLIQFLQVFADECDTDLDDVFAILRIMPEGREVAEVSAALVVEKLRALIATADTEGR